MEIKELKADMRNVDIRFRVIDKGEIKEISTRDGKELQLAEVEVGDESGRIYLTLWDKSIEELDEGDIAEVKNGFIKVIRNELRLNVGKYGKLIKIDDQEFVKASDIPDFFPQPPEGYRPPYRRKYRK
jgi:replication factor A1